MLQGGRGGGDIHKPSAGSEPSGMWEVCLNQDGGVPGKATQRSTSVVMFTDPMSSVRVVFRVLWLVDEA